MGKTIFATVSEQTANSFMLAIAKTMSESTLIMLLLFTAALLAIFSFIWHWKDGKMSPKALCYLIACIMLLPVGGSILAPKVFSILDKSIEKTGAKLVENIVYATKNNMAPNSFIEAVAFSASRKIDNPALLKDIYFISEHCIPRTTRPDGSKILLTDVVKHPSSWDFSSKLVGNLTVDTTEFEASGRLINCRDLVKSVNKRLTSENAAALNKSVTTYSNANELQEKLLAVSLNTSRLSVIENQVIGQMGAKLAYSDGDYTGTFNVSKSVLAAQAIDASGSAWSTVWGNASNTGNRIARVLGNQRSTEIASLANQISETQYEIPYIVGRYRVILDLLLFPAIILLGYGWKAPIYTWVGARFVVTFIPIVVYVLGLSANAELIEISKLKTIGDAALASGWSEDLVRHCANILSFHQKSVMAVLTIGPLASAFGAIAKNKVFSSVSQAIGGAATHFGVRHALTSAPAKAAGSAIVNAIAATPGKVGAGTMTALVAVAKFIPFKGQLIAAASAMMPSLSGGGSLDAAGNCFKRKTNNGVQPHGASNNQAQT